MRLIGLLVSLAVIGYIITIYMDGSVGTEDNTYSSQVQEKIKSAEDSVNQMNEVLKQQQKKMDEVD